MKSACLVTLTDKKLASFLYAKGMILKENRENFKVVSTITLEGVS